MKSSSVNENNEEIENYAAQDFEIMITMEATRYVWEQGLELCYGARRAIMARMESSHPEPVSRHPKANIDFHLNLLIFCCP